MLALSLDGLQVREYFFGWMFLASGTLRGEMVIGATNRPS